MLSSLELPPEQADTIGGIAGQLVALALEDHETGEYGRLGVRATTITAHLTPSMQRALVTHLAGIAAAFAASTDMDTRAAVLTAHDRRRR